MPAGIGYGLKRVFSPKYAGQQAFIGAARRSVRGSGLSGQRGAYKAPQGGYLGPRGGNTRANSRVDLARRRGSEAYDAAYSRVRNRNMVVGFGATALMYPDVGQTGPNQSTFARRGMQNRRTVGISSGAIKDFRYMNPNRAIGGM